MIIAAHVEPAGIQAIIGAGKEVKVFSAFVPNRRNCVRHIIADLDFFAGFYLIDKDRFELIVIQTCISDPFSVR